MLLKAKKRAKKLGINAKLRLGDVSRLPFRKQTFDYVIDSLGMCSYPDTVKALKEMVRVCKKGGKILLLEHGISNNNFIRRMQERNEHKHYQRVGCSLLKDYSAIFKKSNLKEIKIKRRFFGIIYMIEIKI